MQGSLCYSTYHSSFHRIKTIAMDRCFTWLNAITALTIFLMVTLKTLGLPMILSEEIVLTKRKLLQIHMLTFSFESSRKERLLQIYAQITSWIEVKLLVTISIPHPTEKFWKWTNLSAKGYSFDISLYSLNCFNQYLHRSQKWEIWITFLKLEWWDDGSRFA